MNKYKEYTNENELIVRLNPLDDSYVDFFRERKSSVSDSKYDYLWTVHVDSLDPTINYKIWKNLKNVRIIMKIVGGESL